MPINLSIETEYGPLSDVIVGIGEGYHRDPDLVEVVNSTHQQTLSGTGHPDAARVMAEFAAFYATLEAAGVTVHLPCLAPESVQDQTCPRDIGFVIGDTFVRAGMRVRSRVEEIEGIRRILKHCMGRFVDVPDGICLEGGDVVVDGRTIFVGTGQRSDPEGAEFLRAQFAATHSIVPLPCRHGGDDGQDILHLDCTFQPLGLGHALIYPAGLADIPDQIRDGYVWIEITAAEASALASNILSIAPDHIIARTTPACARVNAELRRAGYHVSELDFDAVPSTGGSFRCATLPLRRG